MGIGKGKERRKKVGGGWGKDMYKEESRKEKRAWRGSGERKAHHDMNQWKYRRLLHAVLCEVVW